MRPIRFDGTMYWGQLEMRSGEWWSDRKRASSTAKLKKTSPDSGAGIEKVERCDIEGAPWGRRGCD